MKIVEPSVELWDVTNVSQESHIAHCARVCYGKEYKEPNQEVDEKMVNGLIKRGHLSMLRHASVYINMRVPDYLVEHIKNSDYWTKDFITWYASTNLQEFKYFEKLVKSDKVRLVKDDKAGIHTISNKEFLKECEVESELFKLYRFTFCIVTQDAIAKELNRKSPNAIAEKSTRYCNFKEGIEICKPWWWTAKIGNLSVIDMTQLPAKEKKAAFSWKEAENAYTGLLDEGMKPEDARDVLPKALATKVIYTYSVKEWEDILALRLYDKTGPAHPDCHIVMQMVKDQINEFAKTHNINYQV